MDLDFGSNAQRAGQLGLSADSPVQDVLQRVESRQLDATDYGPERPQTLDLSPLEAGELTEAAATLPGRSSNPVGSRLASGEAAFDAPDHIGVSQPDASLPALMDWIGGSEDASIEVDADGSYQASVKDNPWYVVATGAVSPLGGPPGQDGERRFGGGSPNPEEEFRSEPGGKRGGAELAGQPTPKRAKSEPDPPPAPQADVVGQSDADVAEEQAAAEPYLQGGDFDHVDCTRAGVTDLSGPVLDALYVESPGDIVSDYLDGLGADLEQEEEYEGLVDEAHDLLTCLHGRIRAYVAAGKPVHHNGLQMQPNLVANRAQTELESVIATLGEVGTPGLPTVATAVVELGGTNGEACVFQSARTMADEVQANFMPEGPPNTRVEGNRPVGRAVINDAITHTNFEEGMEEDGDPVVFAAGRQVPGDIMNTMAYASGSEQAFDRIGEHQAIWPPE
jgi:hypothetical protein